MLILGIFFSGHKYAEAAWALESTQQRDLFESMANTIQSTATAVATTDLFMKENLLDGLAWGIAKQVVSQMMQGMIDWVNSGFAGSPAFVTDIEGLLLDSADQAAGEYIESLGGVGEFICSPFSLDVQIALSLSFAAERTGTVTAPSCTLTEIGDNLEGFLSGTVDSWDQWLQVTTNPQNTPYGAYLQAEQEMYARIQNAEGQILAEASWGDGFLSKKICEAVEGTYVGTSATGQAVTSGEQYGQTQGAQAENSSSLSRSGANCIISTPGQVISQQLNQQLGLGSEALIEADEINELISALLNQVTLKAVQGINGLLGMSEGTGYTEYDERGNSYTEAMVIDQIGLNFDLYEVEMQTSRDLEESFIRLINTTATSTLLAIAEQEEIIDDERDDDDPSSGTIRNAENRIAELEALYDDVLELRGDTAQNINELSNLIRQFNTASDTATSTANDKQQNATLEYVELRTSGELITQTRLETYRMEWNRILSR